MSFKHFFPSKVFPAALFLGVGLLTSQRAQAETIGYNVNFSSLGSLAGNSSYNLDFAMVPFGTANNSTTVNFSNFNYGGGSGPSSLGPLSDASTFEEVFSPFHAGNSLSFDITANFTPETTNPDVLSFALFKNTSDFTQTSTTPVTGSATGDGISYFTIAFNGATPAVSTYFGFNPAFAAPTVTVTSPDTTLTPEPTTWAMMGLGLLSLVVLLRRNGKREGEEEARSIRWN